MLVPAEREKLKGIERSDSLVIDPHKGLFLPYGSGVILVRDAEKLAQSHHYQANYMQDANSGEGEGEVELSPADVSPELTKHFRGMRLWLPLKLHGVAPFRACLEEKLMLTRYFHEQVAKIEGIETGPEPDLSITYFRYVAPQDDARDANSFDANRFNEELINRIRSDGRVFLSSTLLHGKFVIRFACLSFRTHLSRVDLLLDLIQENIKLLEGNSV
jgi:glutamate/tyrosine decarboxylase-like PLP-dependent enzyme